MSTTWPLSPEKFRRFRAKMAQAMKKTPNANKMPNVLLKESAQEDEAD